MLKFDSIDKTSLSFFEKKIEQLIINGEKDTVEFKKAQTDLPISVYETVCAFLNTKGGNLLLGVDDKRTITGVNPNSIAKIKQDFTNAMNNNQFINPPFSLGLEEINLDNKTLLHVFIPESSQVHRYKHKIYIRNNEGDYDITNNQNNVSSLYLRKRTSYSENQIFPHVKIEHLRADLISKARKLASIQNPNHPWKEMDDTTLLRTASLYQTNPMNGEEGFTLAAILLLGTDELIASASPAFRIDLIKRVINKERYDDRVDLRTNLIESYDKILEFVVKHMPDPFYLEKDQRISLRETIFREIVANILVHKEYLGAEPTRLIIEKDKIFSENSNKPYVNGLINLDNIQSHPKNPNIAKFFRQLGRVEELGSGVVKLYKYCKAYSGFDPIIYDENIFKFTLPHKLFKKAKKAKDDNQLTINQDKSKINQDKPKIDQDKFEIDQDKSKIDQDKFEIDQDTIKTDQDMAQQIIDFCQEAKSLKEIMTFAGYKNKSHFRKVVLTPLIERGFVEKTIPEKTTSRHQQYVATGKNEELGVC